jgi:hypothetical protein
MLVDGDLERCGNPGAHESEDISSDGSRPQTGNIGVN